MILLSNTETLTLTTLGTGKVDYTAYYADHTPETFTLGTGQGTVSAVTTTTLVGTPLVATQRQIKTVIVVNRDTTPTAQTVVIAKGSQLLTANVPLGTGESLEYLGDRGWNVLNRQGAVKVHSAISGPVSSLALGPLASGIGVTTRAPITGGVWSLYIGKSPRYPVSSLQVRYRTTVAGVGVTWAELGVYVGTSQHGANATSTMTMVQARCVGYANVVTNVESIGIHNTTVPMLTGVVIPPDEDVWILYNSEFVTSGCTLSASLHDDLVSGTLAAFTAASRRPSVDLGQAVGLLGLGTLSVHPTFQVYW